MTGFHKQPMMSEKSLTHLTGFSVNILPAYLVDAPISDREPRATAVDNPSVVSGIK
jgi:hypothetical protein